MSLPTCQSCRELYAIVERCGGSFSLTLWLYQPPTDLVAADVGVKFCILNSIVVSQL